MSGQRRAAARRRNASNDEFSICRVVSEDKADAEFGIMCGGKASQGKIGISLL